MLHKPPILDALDYLLMAGGAVVLIAAAWRWRRGGWRDPLRGSPIRANKLTPIMLWCCLMAYVAGSGGGWWLGERLAPAGMTGTTLDAWQGVVAASVTQVLVVATCLVVASRAFRAGLSGFGFGRGGLGVKSHRRDAGATQVAGATRILGCTVSGTWTAFAWIAGGLLAALCCTGVVVLVVQCMIRLVWPGYQPPEHGVFTMLESAQATRIMRFAAIASAAILAPLGEECLFRGIVQTSIKKIVPPRPGSMYHRWLAIAATAGIFGLMHAGTPQFVPALVVLGVLLGYLYERTGSLWTPIAVHLLFNAKSLLWYHLQEYLAGS
jgi:membrane protease YdiL (CAAX protease family)